MVRLFQLVFFLSSTSRKPLREPLPNHGQPQSSRAPTASAGGRGLWAPHPEAWGTPAGASLSRDRVPGGLAVPTTASSLCERWSWGARAP